MSTTSRPYFLWDYDLTEADVHAILQAGDDTERVWLVSRILESARYEDVWKYLAWLSCARFSPICDSSHKCVRRGPMRCKYGMLIHNVAKIKHFPRMMEPLPWDQIKDFFEEQARILLARISPGK